MRATTSCYKTALAPRAFGYVAKSGGKIGFATAGGRYRLEVPGTKISGKIKKFIMKVTIQLLQ
jgi:hypothetical protein